jgi:nucleoside-diphosphate-sugar epimerase
MYPSDMAYGILRVLAEGISSVSYNIGSPHGITLNCLANKIASNFTQQPEIVFQNANNKNLQKSKFVPDISILQEKLGFQEKVNIDEAIKRSIAWHKETLN